jgi:hypothetical protein
MRNLELRVERLERQVVSTAACYCWAVVHDEEQEPQACPHGRHWFGVVRIRHEERGPVQP